MLLKTENYAMISILISEYYNKITASQAHFL